MSKYYTNSKFLEGHIVLKLQLQEIQTDAKIMVYVCKPIIKGALALQKQPLQKPA